MALAEGAYTPGSPSSTGAYTYSPGGGYPQYYAGSFFIDTGYDDPVLWTTGVDAAEVYQARVYGASGQHYVATASGTYTGKWLIAATPTWTAKFWATPHGNTTTQQRILIKCDVYLSEPVSTSEGAWQRLDSVNWSLYRV